MTSLEAAGSLQEEINNAHTQLEQGVRSARKCAVDSLALLITMRADLQQGIVFADEVSQSGLQQLVQDLDEEILGYREAVGHIADSEAYVTAFSPRQAG
ncbi:MAG TPA: hypothetical protein PJ984_01985 [Candidatus Saccharibacteria bacterium]|jgi:hypothetical protein|nr:hypothetical protein [Patescibacteria group bacterium]HMS31144.1 hypothetical protein [Candidatus Saccharibacteria bacterium]